MPWYKFTARHGPGHQSDSRVVKWFDEPLTDETKEEVWDSWVTREFFHNAIGEVELIEELPPDEIASKILDYQAKIAASQEMIEILEGGKPDTEPSCSERPDGGYARSIPTGNYREVIEVTFPVRFYWHSGGFDGIEFGPYGRELLPWEHALVNMCCEAVGPAIVEEPEGDGGEEPNEQGGSTK